MPLVKKIGTDAGVLGLWEMLEPLDELEHKFNFSRKEKSEYSAIKSIRRKTEYLCARLLTEILIGKKVEIIYLESGKPVLINEHHHISISHSKNLVAVLISKIYQTGIDTETTDRNIDMVTKRFLSPEEAKHIQESSYPQIEKIVYWCAKESIFKCTQNQGIHFNTQIAIEPFQYQKEGYFFGKLILENSTEKYKLWYFPFKNNMIVYCVPLIEN